jgi:predicted DNA-binding transcriptional regulator YafY
MNRLDRALGILLLLRSGAIVPAAELARRFEVSSRTIYRDIDVLSGVGVPVYAEMGRNGGFRLAEGYFLPPIMFSNGEAAALLVGVAMLRRLRATPFAAELETSARKVLAALPEPMRAALGRAEQAIGFEAIPTDLLHPERDGPAAAGGDPDGALRHESDVLSGFLRALLEPAAVALRYRSPYAKQPAEATVAPLGLLWDRDRWYLVGAPAGEGGEPRLWRADRVLALRREAATAEPPAFDMRAILGRRWLQRAMARWAAEAPVVIALTAEQAARLGDDWYYRHARFEPLPDGRVAMTFGEGEPAVVLALLRWLGPGAELLEPRAWRRLWREELLAMLAAAGEE